MWKPFGLFNRRGGVDPEYSAIRMSFGFRQETYPRSIDMPRRATQNLLMKNPLFSILIFIASGFSAGVTFANSPGIPRFPDVDQTRIVFVYAGDLWIVPKSGGTAVRLTNAPGPKSNLGFSPDGQTIAFTGTYNGIYTIPLAGGQP